jgi:hypothetical protein
VVGQSAKLRLDMAHMRERIGQFFNQDWMPLVSSKPGDHTEQSDDYHALMRIFGNEMKGL